MNYIFKGKHVNETINRFELSLINKNNNSVLNIPNEINPKDFILILKFDNNKIANVTNQERNRINYIKENIDIYKYSYLSLENVELDEDSISQIICLYKKPIYININNVNFNFNINKSILIKKYFKIIDCSKNDIYPLENMYTILANNINSFMTDYQDNSFYIFTRNSKYKHKIDFLSSFKEILTIDIYYNSILQMLDILNNEIKFSTLPDVHFIMLSFPKTKFIDKNDGGKIKNRYLNQDEIDNCLTKLYELNENSNGEYKFILTESLEDNEEKRKLDANKFDKIIEVISEDIIRIYK